MLEFILIGLLSGAGCGGIYLSGSDFRFSFSGLESELQRANLKCKRCLLCKPNENKVNIAFKVLQRRSPTFSNGGDEMVVYERISVSFLKFQRYNQSSYNLSR